MKIDHIGYAVKDIEKAKKSMSALGFIFGESVEDTARNVLISFGELDGYRIELVAPLAPPPLLPHRSLYFKDRPYAISHLL